ncbi:hypothetical protein [Erythrobacter ani]|uniref:Uncharacterized protein n=1 Tax=Erythrobacter ani TaxID=2827235 RepID=A0ABS6SJG7_9SPHN|nr:hypothetical protein [Erythrobacter ani]MBV7265140.1 hypothetical protein [Erythrobacter ani]
MVTPDFKRKTILSQWHWDAPAIETHYGRGRLATYDRTNIGAQSYTYNGLGDWVRIHGDDKLPSNKKDR